MDDCRPREQGLDPKYVLDRKHWRRSTWPGDKGRCRHVNEFDNRGVAYEEEMFRDYIRRIKCDINETILKYKE